MIDDGIYRLQLRSRESPAPNPKLEEIKVERLFIKHPWLWSAEENVSTLVGLPLMLLARHRPSKAKEFRSYIFDKYYPYFLNKSEETD